MSGDDLLEHLRAENARLIALLEAHGVEWRLPDEPPLVEPTSSPPLISSSLDTDAKLALFRRLFRGRTDVFPVRWESKAGKSGYSLRISVNVTAHFANNVTDASVRLRGV